MAAKIKYPSKQNIRLLLNELEDIIEIKTEGKITYKGFSVENIIWLLLSIVDFGSFLNIESKKKILNNTFAELAKSSDFSEKMFLNILNQQISIHNSSKFNQFYLLTTLSIKNPPLRKISFNGVTILMHGNNFPKKFRQSRKEILDTFPPKKENLNFCKVSVNVQAKNYLDAYDKGEFYLEIFRSFLCLLSNAGLEIRFGDNESRPINKVQRGEVSTMHDNNGDAAAKNIHWIIPNYYEAQVYEIPNEKKSDITPILKKYVTLFNKCSPNHQRGIGKALYNYVSAFDERNKHISFIRAWLSLENLCDTDQNDTLIKRCLAQLSPDDRKYHKQVLEALKLYRNELVHQDFNGPDPLFACFQIQQFINILLRFNLRYAGFFNNLEEAVFFLDNFHPDIKRLKSQKKIIDKIIKIKNV
jgi:hypothetical protein